MNSEPKVDRTYTKSTSCVTAKTDTPLENRIPVTQAKQIKSHHLMPQVAKVLNEANKANAGMSMGIGKLASPELVFVRQFRFTISSQRLEADYNFSVDVDWTGKTLKLCAYEVSVPGVGIPIWNWADAMEQCRCPGEALTLVTYDGCGKEIYRKRFDGLGIVKRENKFNYEKSDVSMHEVTISFNTVTDLSPRPWKGHPVVDKGHAEVNHLNAKMWVK